MKNGENSIKQGSTTCTSKDLSRITSRLETIVITLANIEDLPTGTAIMFHNLSRYDAHLFIKELGKKFYKGKLGVIAENKEKYISFHVDVVVDWYENEWGKIKERKIQLRFIDNIRFMESSLDALSSNLGRGTEMVCKECKENYEITHVD